LRGAAVEQENGGQRHDRERQQQRGQGTAEHFHRRSIRHGAADLAMQKTRSAFPVAKPDGGN
jgi:hypothetical protein